MKLAALLALLLFLTACSSVGVGVGIPGTPVSVGGSVPVGGVVPSSRTQANLPIQVETVPPGAKIRVNNTLMGSSPLRVYVPFGRGFWGAPKGTAQLIAEKEGYQIEGVPLFAVPGGISNDPKGQPIRTLTINMRREQ